MPLIPHHRLAITLARPHAGIPSLYAHVSTHVEQAALLSPWPAMLQYAALATQIGTIQQAEAPRRIIRAVSPAIKKVKRKAALPPEARRGPGGGK